MIEARIYIGLNDKEKCEQIFSLEKYKSIVKLICRNYRVNFSMYKLEGGYFYEDNVSYVEENTIMITLIGIEKETVNEIAKDMCAFFNQESVMIVYNPVTIVSVKENL